MAEDVTERWYRGLAKMLEERGLTMEQAAEFCGMSALAFKLLISPRRGEVSRVLEFGLAAIFDPGWLEKQRESIVIDAAAETGVCEDCGASVSRARKISPFGTEDSPWRVEYEGAIWVWSEGGDGKRKLYIKCPACTREFFREYEKKHAKDDY